MGAWGEGPYDNDTAADWLHEVFEETGFCERVIAGLATGRPDIVRAAAWVVGVLGEVYVWPIDRLDDDRAEACRALEGLLADEEWMGTWGDRARAEAALRAQLDALR